jgi:Flp pilus assembly protein TadG
MRQSVLRMLQGQRRLANDAVGCSDLLRRPRVLREEGAAAVEMALACSILFALLLGSAQMCLLFYAYHFVSDAAREATRFAMVRGGNCITNVSQAFCSPTDTNSAGADNGDIQAYVRGLGYPYANGLNTTTTWYSISGTTFTSCGTTPGGCNTPDVTMVQVTASYNFPVAIPFWGKNSISISSTSAQLIQQ